MKKMLVLLLACVFVLSACSSGGGKEGGAANTAKKEITIWAWDPNFNIAALNIAKEMYTAKHPDVKVNIVEYAQEDIVQKLNTGLSSGTTKGLPNIVLIEDYRAQSFLQAYPDSFHNMTGVIDPSAFAAYKIGPTSMDGKQYGVPFDSGVAGLYVRTDYLKQAGYTVQDLTNITWDRYIEIGKQIKAKTGKNLMSQDPNSLGTIRMMLQSAGSWYLKEDGKTPNIAGNPAMKEALETYKKFMSANIITMVSDWNQFLAAFNSGNVATVPTGNWITPSIKAEASQAGKWAVVPFPRMAGNHSVNSSNLGGSSWYVMNMDGQDTAAEFLKETFGSSTELYQKLLTKIGAIGSLKAAAKGGAYDEAQPFFGGQKIYADFSKWSEQIPRINYGVHTYAIEDIMAVAVQNYLNGKDVDSVIKDAQAQAEAQLK